MSVAAPLLTDDRAYHVPEVCWMVGISYRQLDYWARTGLIRPSVRDAQGPGTQRLYSFQDLVALKVIKSLLDIGLSLQRIRRAGEYLRGMRKPAYGVTLISDGLRLYEANSPEAALHVLSTGRAVVAISIDRIWTELEAKGRRKRRGDWDSNG